MTRAGHWVGAIAAALGCSAPGPAPGPAAAGASTVVLISLDGVRHDYPERGALPALSRMAREGLRAERLLPVTPASTFPAHVSLATGTPPDVHGIVANRFWDPARGEFDYDNDADWIEAEPLWAAAERQGVAAATFFWVGSGSDWRGIGARYRRAPFDTRIGEAEKVEQILDWLDLPVSERPRLVMSWWHGADRAGHRLGPDHPGVIEALEKQDRHLDSLLAALDARDAWSYTTLLVVSDHGMSTAEHGLGVRKRLKQAGVRARLIEGSAIAHLFSDDPDEIARAERALAGVPGLRVDRRAALPRELRLAHPTRSGDLVLRAAPNHTFRSVSRLATLAGRRPGRHGYSPDHPDMAGILFALGRGVPAGARLGDVSMLDVAPTVAALLGIDPPAQSEGRALDLQHPD